MEEFGCLGHEWMIACVWKCVKTKVSVAGCLYFSGSTVTLQLLGVTA